MRRSPKDADDDQTIRDRSMVEELHTGSDSSMVPALANLSLAINAKICISVIKTRHQLQWLLNLEVDLVEGDYLEYPQPIEQNSATIARGKRSSSELNRYNGLNRGNPSTPRGFSRFSIPTMAYLDRPNPLSSLRVIAICFEYTFLRATLFA